MNKFCIGLAMAAAMPAMGQLVNRSIVTDPGGGIGGADASAICLGGNIFGFGHQIVNLNRVADKFMVPASDTAGWDVDEICFYGYQTGATTVTINACNFRVVEGGVDPAAGVVVFGDQTTNRATSIAFSNIYRTTQTDKATASTRRLQLVKCAISPPLHLDAGKEYWIDWQMGGTAASGPWSPPSSDTTQACIIGTMVQDIATSGVWNPVWSDNVGLTMQSTGTFIVKGEVTQSCYPDCEGDGDLDVFDFLCFQGGFANQTAYADCEGDGDWDVFDFLCFQGKFAAGC